jgi:putative nucleotidyltransferase with HDIG domain
MPILQSGWLDALRSRAAARPSWRQAAAGSAIAAAIAWLVAGAAFGPRIDYAPGETVRAEIVAPDSFSVVDTPRTEQLRSKAEAEVPTIFDFEPRRHRTVVDQLATSLAEMRERYEAAGSPAAETFAAENVKDFPLGDEALLALFARRDFAPGLVSRVAEILDARLGSYVVGDSQPAEAQLRVHNVQTGEIYPVFFRNVMRLSDAKAALLADLLKLDGIPVRDRRLLGDALEPLVSVTLLPNTGLTAEARGHARDRVAEVRDDYRAGQIVAFRNQVVDDRVARALAELKARQAAPNRVARWAGIYIFVLILFSAFWRFAKGGLRSTLSQPRAFLFVGLVVLLQVALVRLGFEVVERVGTLSADAAREPQYLYAVPYAVAPLAVALLVDSRLALVVALALVPLVGLMTSTQPGAGMGMALYAAICSIAAVRAGRPYQARLVVVFAALVLAVAGAAGVAAAALLAADPVVPAKVHLANVGVAALGALLSAAIAALALPVFEWGFDIVSDVRLLELANADRKLLRELAIRAPGTHQHSYVMSSIATEAAKAIGANVNLARIGAYYHDIGKLHAPELFIENQGGGPNPHDTMDPAESARQIIRHVTWGVQRAREEGLPPQVLELITGHHGTRTLHFFLEKAKRLAPPGTVVDETQFRYPGPKPQTREAAILMLADGSEAAVRSLESPTRDRIEAIIRKLTDAVLVDDQLDECGMTLEEVATVRQSIVETLLNLYHKRISYPGFNPPPLPAERGAAAND